MACAGFTSQWRKIQHYDHSSAFVAERGKHDETHVKAVILVRGIANFGNSGAPGPLHTKAVLYCGSDLELDDNDMFST